MTLKDLKEYSRMTDAERRSDRGQEIRAEINHYMPWMMKRWRKIVRARYINRKSIVATCMELNIGRSSYFRRLKELSEWLKDTEKYLEEQV